MLPRELAFLLQGDLFLFGCLQLGLELKKKESGGAQKPSLPKIRVSVLLSRVKCVSIYLPVCVKAPRFWAPSVSKDRDGRPKLRHLLTDKELAPGFEETSSQGHKPLSRCFWELCQHLTLPYHTPYVSACVSHRCVTVEGIVVECTCLCS